MAVCGRCQGKGTIKPFTALAPTACSACRGTGIQYVRYNVMAGWHIYFDTDGKSYRRTKLGDKK